MKKRIRVVIYKSNNSIEAQAVDDGRVIAGKKYLFTKKGTTPIDQSFLFGQDFGKVLLQKKVKSISFDRGNHKYHGNIKSFAGGMRKEKVEF